MKRLILPSLLLLSACKVNHTVTCTPDQVEIGMAQEDLTKLCGKAVRENSLLSGHSASIQLVYEGSYSLYVYVENDVVRSKQWSSPR